MSAEKSGLHSRNVHRNGYDFSELVLFLPELKQYVFENNFGTQTINFSILKAVKLLNKALLLKYYQLNDWDIPIENLCPPIPGRTDYVHYLADLLKENLPEIPTGNHLKGLDIGTGANLIYPIIATQTYGWKMVGTDINEKSLLNAQQILFQNSVLQPLVELQLQLDSHKIFRNIILPEDRFVFSMCNPPFHDSQESTLKGNLRKNKNLSKTKQAHTNLNFGGQQTELWCEGGELSFISGMIKESAEFSSQVLWFTSLVSKKDNLFKLKKALEKVKVNDFRVIEMSQGQKVSRFLAWTFIPQKERKSWFN